MNGDKLLWFHERVELFYQSLHILNAVNVLPFLTFGFEFAFDIIFNTQNKFISDLWIILERKN